MDQLIHTKVADPIVILRNSTFGTIWELQLGKEIKSIVCILSSGLKFESSRRQVIVQWVK